MRLPNKYFSFVASIAILVSCSESNPRVSIDENPNVEQSASTISGVAYTNFNLIDGSDVALRNNQAMIVNDGQIVWVGNAPNLPEQGYGATVDLSGMYVMPGIIDLHIHLSVLDNFALTADAFTLENIEKELGLYASYGVTSVLSMGTEKELIVDYINEQRRGSPEVSRVFSAGHGVVYLDGYGGVPGINNPVSTPEEARQEVLSQIAKGVDVIKLWVDDEFGTMPLMPEEISQAVIDAAHDNNTKAVAHVFKLEDAKRLIRQGVDGFVHNIRDAAIDQEYIQLSRDHDVWLVAGTLSREAALLSLGDNPDYLSDPFFTRGVDLSVLNTIRSESYQEAIRNGPHYDQFREIFEYAKMNTGAIYENGLPITLGTDSGPPGRFPGYSSHWELELLVESGLTPHDAIQAATSHAADFLGWGERLGEISEGKLADFIVLNSNPLENILNTREIASVFINGNKVYDASATR